MPYQGQVKSRDARTLSAVKTTIMPSLTGLILDMRGFQRYSVRVPAAITQAAASPPAAAPLAAPVQTAGASSATAGALVALTTYFYKVTALSANGESVGSNEVAITTAAGQTSTTVNWQAVAGATGYRVYRGTASGAESVYYAPGAVTTFNDTGAANTAGTPPVAAAPAAPGAPTLTTTAGGSLAAATTYYYKVTALNSSGESVGSAEASILTGASVGNSNTVTWQPVAGATAYRVYRGTAAGAENVQYSVGPFTSYIDTGAAPAAPSVTLYRSDYPQPALGAAPQPLGGAMNLIGTYAASTVTVLTVDWPFVQVVPTGAPVDVFTLG